MSRTRISARPTFRNLAAWSAGVAVIVGAFMLSSAPQARGAMQGAMQQPAPKPFPLTLTIADGTTANYRVREQLVGISFPNDAIGTSTAVTGEIVFNKDGSIDSSKSNLVFDLRTLKSDQSMRDGFIQGRTLQTSQYPNAVFVAKTITGMPNPLTGQFGFELSGDMTIHGTTAPLTWQGIATVDGRSGTVSGRISTGFPFEKFGMSPPKIFRVMSVNDSITLEVAYHAKIS
ncbi:MAG TPA: YceI family protein [Gemmatimonadaceae bacterium]